MLLFFHNLFKTLSNDISVASLRIFSFFLKEYYSSLWVVHCTISWQQIQQNCLKPLIALKRATPYQLKYTFRLGQKLFTDHNL